MKQSFCYPLFLGEGTLDALFAEAARIGYPAVEWWFRDKRFDEALAAAKNHGLSIASICGHTWTGDGKGGLNDPEQHDRIESELRESIQLAAEHGISGLICFSGNRRPGQSDEDAVLQCVEGFRRVAPLAEGAGVTLNLELLNSKQDHPGYQADHTAWGVEVCRRIGSPRVRLLYDIYHMQIMEGDVIRTIRENIEWIGHFHTAGNPGRNDLDAHQELNYSAISRAIAETGHDGYLGHEFSPKGDPYQALESAFHICNFSGSAS